MFLRTTAINKILKMKARKRVIQGGTSAGKTYAIIPVLINRAIREDKIKITVVAETLPAVKEGAVDIFKTVMQDTGRWRDAGWNASSLTYTFKNGSRIQFKSFDTEGKAKASGKRDILFLNEANHIAFGIADALMIRSKEIYIDFNPDNEFWAHTEVLTEPNSEFLLLTYEDNEAIPKETLEDLLIKKAKAYHNPNGNLKDSANIKSDYWVNWWRVYGLGEIGSLQGTVFSFTLCKNIPPTAKRVAYGLDWGYTNDPTAMPDVWREGNKLYIDELIYQTGMTNGDIIRRMNDLKIDKRSDIIADSAEPKSIQDIYLGGYQRIYPAQKGPDSIKNSIDTLQEFELYVTERSINAIKEFRKYCWTKDKEGKQTNVPIDAFNHLIDGVRYVALNKLKKQREIILD